MTSLSWILTGLFLFVGTMNIIMSPLDELKTDVKVMLLFGKDFRIVVLIKVIGVFCLFLSMGLIRIFLVLREIKTQRQTRKIISSQMNMKRTKTLVVLGSGGHTTEMLHLLSSIQHEEFYSPIDYIVASTDTNSVKRIEALNSSNFGKGKKKMSLPPHQNIYQIPRSREVGQSYLTSIFTTLYSIFYTAHLILFKIQPDLLLINGPGTSLPVALWTFIARVLHLSRGNIIFIESFCRVKTLSLTGKILWIMGITDMFMVHWHEALQKDMILLDCFIEHDT